VVSSVVPEPLQPEEADVELGFVFLNQLLRYLADDAGEFESVP